MNNWHKIWSCLLELSIPSNIVYTNKQGHIYSTISLWYYVCLFNKQSEIFIIAMIPVCIILSIINKHKEIVQ